MRTTRSSQEVNSRMKTVQSAINQDVPTLRKLRGGSRARRGQTLVFALLALIVLSFAGALFISIITRSLQNSGNTANIRNADFYAQAGLEFADSQLTDSVDGADWRPPAQQVASNDPDFNLINPPASPDGFVHGYSRYTYGNGRFLIKITYDPVNLYSGPNSAAGPGFDLADSNHYIKIESIGRVGVIDPTDPTTFENVAQNSNATLVAYKQIGLTDYARFITDPNNTGQVAGIGVPSLYYLIGGFNVLATPGVNDFIGNNTTTLQQYPIVMNIGAPDAYFYTTVPNAVTLNPKAGLVPFSPGNTATYVGGGGSFRSNTSVRFYGDTNFFLDRGTSSNGVSPLPALFDEGIEVAGNIYDDGYVGAGPIITGNPASQVRVSTYELVGGVEQINNLGVPINPSASGSFFTYGGAVRDSGTIDNAPNPQPRQIKRLEPPVMDAVDPLSNLPRYRELTLNSQPLTSYNGTVVNQPNPSANGYGRYTYINNFQDTQPEDRGNGLSVSLPKEWTDPNENTVTNTPNNPGPFWQNNDIYSPPGVDIRFGPQPDSANLGKFKYGYSITRHDVYRNSTTNLLSPVQWLGPTGVPNGTTFTVYYDDLGASNDPTTINALSHTPIPNDVIIYAEGNVRLSGIVSADPNDPVTNATNRTKNGISHLTEDQVPRHVTIVTNGTAYIDGSLLKGNPDSSIAVLAHDYVCVNTTQFFAGTDAPLFLGANGDALNGGNANSVQPSTVTLSAGTLAIRQEFSFGLTPGVTPAAAYGGGSLYLYLSADLSAASVNSSPNVTFTDSTAAAAYAGNITGAFTTTNLTRTTVQVAPGAGNLETAVPSPPTVIGLDVPAGATANANLERVAIFPNDVRIEALLFAETKSFFVIPGRWFNTSNEDSPQTLDDVGHYSAGTNTGGQHSFAAGTALDNRFPFYGQPVDLKLTIAGTVTEAMTADVGDEAQWMQHWGWIPKWHGGLIPGNTTGQELSPHWWGTAAQYAQQPGLGLTMVYDPNAGYPYDRYATGAGPEPGNVNGYLRVDGYGNPLPFTPKLPVCPGLIYQDVQSGEATP